MRLRLATLALASLALSLLTIAPATPMQVAHASGCDAPIGNPMPVGAGHDHTDPTQHAFSTTNYEKIGHLNPADLPLDLALAAPVVDLDALPPGDEHEREMVRAGLDTDGRVFGEVSLVSVPLALEGGKVVTDGRYAAIAGVSSPLYVYVLDVKDPSSPKLVGKWKGPAGGYITDVKWSTGGGALYASVQGGSSIGLFLIDATDKAAPATVEQWKIPGGVHMIGTYPHPGLPGVDVVYGATAYSSGVYVAYATADLPVKSFVKLPTITGVVAHDVWAGKDDLTGKDFLYVANSYGGAVVFDVTNPQAPVRLGQWPGEGVYMHTIRAEVRDGKRVVIVSPEIGGSSGGPAKLYALDATDLSNIRRVGTWSNPGGVPPMSGWTFSTHNFQLVNGTIYLAHYHGGVWTIDARDPTALATRGYYLPHSHRYSGSGAWAGVMRMAPADWDVVLHEGRQYVGDMSGGLYVLRYTCDKAGPGGPTSTG